MIKQETLEYCKKWANKKEIFIGAINYIEHGKQVTRKTKLEQLDVDSLCDILIKEIENRMPVHCRQCDEWYIVRLDDKPEIHCMWCQVGKHDCTKTNDSLDKQRFKWLCGKCEPVFTKHFLPKLDQIATFEGFEGIVESVIKESNAKENKSAKPQNDGDANSNKNSSTSIPDGDEDMNINNGNNNNRIDGRNASNQRNNDNNNRNNDNNSNNSRNEDGNTCWFYVNHKCKFGRNCNKEHPEACQQLLEFGVCNGGNNCKLLHPKLCKNFMSRKGCTRHVCWFVHPSEIGKSNHGRRMPHRPPVFRQNENNMRPNQYYESRSGQSSNNLDFLGNWPTPAETIQQQAMKRLIGMVERMDVRMEKMESQYMTRWSRYNP